MADERVQRRLAAILAADVVGYSRLTRDDEAGTRARLNDQLNKVIRPTIGEHRGRVVKTMGDGFLVEFASVVDAVQAAAEIQKSVASEQIGEPDGRKMLLRIGIHLGDVIVEGDDIHGDGVNIAARLEGLAEPGGICISAIVHESIGNKLEIPFVDLGEQTVKNIAEPVRTYRANLDADEAPPPSLAATDLDSFLKRPAVAVLPFVNMGGDPEQDYFADGLTEDIITALSLWRSFPVIARNSTFSYKGQSPDVRNVANELGARYVIEGSVRKAGNRVRITVQVIDATTGHHLWADRYDRDLEDFFDIQDEIAQRVAATVEPELAKAEHKRSVGKTTSSLDAWECFHRGLILLEKLSQKNHAEARKLFERAIELDPGFSQAYAGLALSYHRDIYTGFADDPEAWIAECLKAAEQAVEIDDRDPFAHAMLGFALIWSQKPQLAIVQCEKAIAFNPSSAWGRGVLAFALLCSGRHQESIAAYDKALDLNPTDPTNYIRTTFLAEAHMDTGDYEQAVDWAQRSIGRASHHLHAHLVLAASLGYLDRHDEARAVLAECERIQPAFAGSLREFWSFRTQKDLELLRDGLRKAGWTG